AIYGGIIAGALTILVICKLKKIKLTKALDMAAPAVMIGQIVGRWGNFFNGEAFGEEVLESEFLYFIRMGLSHGNGVEITSYYHPTFLYESLWNLIGFVIINLLYKKKKFDGQVVLMYVTWYGFGRMLIEGLRTDSLYLGVFRISQIVGFACFVVGAVLLIYNLTKARRADLTQQEYVAAYPKFSHAIAPDEDMESKENGEDGEVAEDQSQEMNTDVEEDTSEEIDEEARQADISDKLKNLFGDDKN
ncbi:MAG: prolipoprotein diacylglyceryl transferase, partial [Oscillospiraceae bacterium]|nr:prolipoprotein diacylglyceryl transferase [Oscillospiraceae bacterium]